MLWTFRVGKPLSISFFPDEKILRSTPSGVLTAHTEWLPGVWLRHSVPPVAYQLCNFDHYHPQQQEFVQLLLVHKSGFTSWHFTQAGYTQLDTWVSHLTMLGMTTFRLLSHCVWSFWEGLPRFLARHYKVLSEVSRGVHHLHRPTGNICCWEW